RSAGPDVVLVDFGSAIRYPTAPFSRRKTPPHPRRAIPGAAKEAFDAREHPSGLSQCESPLRLRGVVGDAIDARRPAPGYLQQLPSVLHGEAEADGYAGADRSVQAEVCECAREAREAQEGSEGRTEGVGEERQGPGQGKEGEEGARSEGLG